MRSRSVLSPLLRNSRTLAVIGLITLALQAQCAEPDSASQIIPKIDASVASREDNLIGYTVSEHYRVFRNGDTAHPAAEMTVKTTYRKDQGKSFVVLTQSGSQLLLKEVLGRILDSEHTMTLPANRSQAVLSSANYEIKQPQVDTIDGRPCVRVTISPRRSSPYLFHGNIWVDADDGSIVKLEGTAARSASVLTGPAEVSRQYAKINGLPMAIRAEARTGSWMLGQTTIKIDYSDYQMTLRAGSAVLRVPESPVMAAPPR